MVGWHHGLNGHEFEQTPGEGEGQGSLVCCSPWGCKELDTTMRLNNNLVLFLLLNFKILGISMIFDFTPTISIK